MKRKIATIFSIIVVLSLCACHPVMEKAGAMNKGGGVLEKELKKKNVVSAEAPSAEIWKETLKAKDGGIRIHVNAVVNRPDKSRLSAVSCRSHYFTLDEVKSAIKLFYGDAKLYDNTLDDKDWLQTEIQNMKANLAYLKENGKYPVVEREEGRVIEVPDLDAEITWLEGRIVQYEDAYKAAVDGSSGIEEIKMETNDTGGELINVKDGQTPPMEFYVYNCEDVNDAAMKYSVTGASFSSFTSIEPSEQLDLDISREEAEQKALDTALACGVSECEIVDTGKAQAGGQLCYIFTLGRMIGGVSDIPVKNYKISLSQGSDGKDHREPWKQENIQVMVNDKGVVGFLWEYPPEILETVNDNVSVKFFDEITETARTILPLQFAEEALVDEKKDVTITEINLSMMRVAKVGKENEYNYLPVWDFMGYYGENMNPTVTEDNPRPLKSFLTLNAVDGSVIDRGMGY